MIALASGGSEGRARVAAAGGDGARAPATDREHALVPACSACFFRHAGLCAMTDGPCPTFRPLHRGLLPAVPAEARERLAAIATNPAGAR
jgi:hypothetical protein